MKQEMISIGAVKSTIGLGHDGISPGVVFLLRAPIRQEDAGKYQFWTMGTDLALVFAKEIQEVVEKASRGDGEENPEHLLKNMLPREVS